MKGSVDRTEYANSELTDGSTVSNADRNFFQYRVQARVSYEFTPAVKPFVEMDVDQRKYGTPCTCDGIDRSSHAFTPRGGVTFELARHLTGEVSAGYTTRDYVSPDLQTLRGWVLDSSLIWVATGLTTVTLSCQFANRGNGDCGRLGCAAARMSACRSIMRSAAGWSEP